MSGCTHILVPSRRFDEEAYETWDGLRMRPPYTLITLYRRAKTYRDGLACIHCPYFVPNPR